MQKKVLNLTKTPLRFLSKDGSFITIPSSGEIKLEIIRIDNNDTAVDVSGFEIRTNKTIVNSFKNLPKEREDTILIVPTIVYTALSHIRSDIFTIDEPFKDNGVVRYAKSISRQSVRSINEDFEKISKLSHLLFSSIDSNMKNAEKCKDIIFKIKSIADKY